MTYEEAIRKAAACLRLAADKRGSPEEAACAAAAAQRIMDKFNISAEQASSHGTDRDEADQFADPGTPVCETGAKNVRWMGYLIHVIGRHNGCASYKRQTDTGGAKFFFVGRLRDIQTASYLTGLLEREVYRLSRDGATYQGDKYRGDFRFGVVDAVNLKLAAQRKQTEAEVVAEAAPGALVHVKAALARVGSRSELAQRFLEANRVLNKPKPSRASLREDARRAGFRAGQTIEVNRATAAIGGNNKRVEGRAS